MARSKKQKKTKEKGMKIRPIESKVKIISKESEQTPNISHEILPHHFFLLRPKDFTRMTSQEIPREIEESPSPGSFIEEVSREVRADTPAPFTYDSIQQGGDSDRPYGPAESLDRSSFLGDAPPRNSSANQGIGSQVDDSRPYSTSTAEGGQFEKKRKGLPWE